MLRDNLDVCVDVLSSIKVSAFHLHPVVCVGLAALLKEAGVCHFSVKASAAEVLNSRGDEILLMDIESFYRLEPCLSQRLEQCCAPKTVIVASSEQLDRLGGRLPENIGSLISPCSSLEDFVDAIVAVKNQETYVDPNLSMIWSRLLAEPCIELTNRQLEVLQLVAKGKTSVQIAGLLGVRPKTVENHRAAIKERMGVVSAAEMVNEAHKRGIC